MLLADHPTSPCLLLGGRVRERMQREIVAAGKKQRAKNGHLFRRARLARTGARRSLSQLGIWRRKLEEGKTCGFISI